MIMSPTALKSEGRQLRHQPGLRRAVQVLHPGRPGPHRGGQGPELLRRRQGPPGQDRLQDHRRLDHPVQQPPAPATSQVLDAVARHRRRRAQGRRQPGAAHLGLARLPGHHHQHRQRQRRRQAGRARCRAEPGQHDGHRRPGAAGVRAEPRPGRPSTQVVFRGQYSPACGPISPASPFSLRRRPGLPEARPGRGQGAADPGRRDHAVQGQHDHRQHARRRPGSARPSRPRSRRAASTCSWCRPSSPPRSTRPTPASTRCSQIGWSGRVDPDGNIANFVALAAARRTTTATPTPTWTRCSTRPGPRPTWPARRDLYGQVITQLHKDAADHLPLPAEELHRRRPHGRGRADVRRRPAALRHAGFAA